MSIYATVDLHGYPLEEFLKLLKKCGFSENDFLFVIGDVIDRNGDGGVGLLRWMMCQPNVELILGNHEKMMLDSRFVFDGITEDSVKAISAEKMDSLSGWLACGGDVTLHSLKELRRTNPDLVEDILSYCEEAPLYESVTAGERDFLLVHAGLGNFAEDKMLSAYSDEELLWTRPALDDRFFKNVKTILGHTPTQYTVGNITAGQ